MFTGLIETIGTARRLARSSGGARLEVEVEWPDGSSPAQGDSISVNGACLTAIGPTERAFAATMANRDHAAFVTFLSDEAVFFSGDSSLRGKQQVADTWKAYFEEADAPFSWEPQRVEVLDSGTLALSTGPVRNSSGELFAYFTSIWRLEENGEWKIIFDKGNRACEEPGTGS